MNLQPEVFRKAGALLASGTCDSGCCQAIAEALGAEHLQHESKWNEYIEYTNAFDAHFDIEGTRIERRSIYYFGRTLRCVNEMHEDPMDDELFADALNHRLMALAMMAAIVEDPA